MEPDVSDQYESVTEYVASRLLMMARAEELERTEATQKRQVNARVPQHVYDKLSQLAADLGTTATGLAADLLELAIYEADGVQVGSITKEEPTT